MRLLLCFAGLAALVYCCTDWRAFRHRAALARWRGVAYGAATQDEAATAARYIKLYCDLLKEENCP